MVLSERLPLFKSESLNKNNILTSVLCLIVICTIIAVIIVATVPSKSDLLLPDRLEPSECSADYKNHPLILISLDGFRQDYLNLGRTPSLNELARKGISTQALVSTFPSDTFPNHYSIVTGLYPSSHGIVANRFYDPIFDEIFTPESSNEGKWFGGEPIWNTLKSKGLKSATYFWVGSEAEIGGQRPDYWKKYIKTSHFQDSMDQAFKWLTLTTKADRPRFISLYFYEPDAAGHQHGPDSEHVKTQLERVDRTIKTLLEGLKERNLLNCVNIIVLSDHGMSSIGPEGNVDLIDYVPDAKNDMVFVSKKVDQFIVRNRSSEFISNLEDSLSCANNSFRLYRKEDLPKRLHYGNNDRIRDYVFLFRDGKIGAVDSDYYANGGHGFDTIYQSMNSIFIGYGPDFKRNVSVEKFSNVEVYNLLCRLLGVSPAPNNGTEGALHNILRNPPSPPELPNVIKSDILRWPEESSSNDSEITDCEVLEAEGVSLLHINEEEEKIIEDIHAPWGTPLTLNGSAHPTSLLFQPDHVTGYSKELKIPFWTSYSTSVYTNASSSAQNSSWVFDKRLPNGQSDQCSFNKAIKYRDEEVIPVPLYYPGFGVNATLYQRLNSLHSNMIHVTSYLLSTWDKFVTNDLQLWLSKRGPLNIILGPVFDSDSNGVADNDVEFIDGVVVPSHMFAVVTKCNKPVDNIGHCDETDLDTLSFVLPQHQYIKSCFSHEEFLTTFMATVKDIERITGQIFFSRLSTYQRIKLNLRIQSEIWR